MEILPLAESDKPELTTLQPPDWKDIIPSIDYYLKSDFCFPFAARKNQQLVGTGTAILHGKTAWLAGIIVHPDFRNEGYGTNITSYLIDHLKKTGAETILLVATPLGEPVYKKLGFEKEDGYIFFKEGKLPEPCNDENIILYDRKYKDDLLKLDYLASGEDRYKSLEEHLENSWLFVQNYDLQGFYLPTLREGLIVAKNDEAGLELMKIRNRNANFAIVPDENEAAIDFLKHHNFKEFRRAGRMYIGKKIYWQQKMIYNRTGGQIG